MIDFIKRRKFLNILGFSAIGVAGASLYNLLNSKNTFYIAR